MQGGDGRWEVEALRTIVGDFAGSAGVLVSDRVGTGEIREEGGGGKTGKVIDMDATDVVAAIAV